MKPTDVKHGMKVVPHSKSSRWGGLESSVVWQRAERNKRPYLFAVGYNDSEGAFVLSYDDPNIFPGVTGDFFDAHDFEPYRDGLHIGMKVVPHSKSAPGHSGLEGSHAWKRACASKKFYLTIKGFEGDMVLLRDDSEDGGDYFLAHDFTPYTEPPQEEETKIEDLKIGLKVVPFTKSIYNPSGQLSDSSEWCKAIEQGQHFLYVARIDPDKIVLAKDLISCTGDFFLREDFVPYTEPTQEEPMQNEKPLSPCTPFEPTSEQPFYFDPFKIDPIASLPTVFAFDTLSEDWHPAYFLGHDKDNSVFEVIYHETRIHTQVQHISPYGKDHVMTADELFDIARRTQMPIQYDGEKWVFCVFSATSVLSKFPVTYPWLFSVRA